MRHKWTLIWCGLLVIAFVAGLFAGKKEAPSGSEAPPGTAPGSLIGSTGRYDEPLVTHIPVPPDRSPESVAVFARETLEESNRVTRMAALMGLIENLTAENWRDVKQAFIDEKQINGRNHHPEWFLFVERAGEVVGEEVLADQFAENRLGGCRAALLGWAKSDPNGAVKWVETVPDPDFRDQIWGSLVIGVAVSDPDLSMRLLEQLPLKNRETYTPNLMATILQSVGPEEGAQVFSDAVGRAEQRGEDGGSDYLTRLFATLANQRITNSKLPGKGEWASKHLGKPYVNDYFITKTAKNIARDNPQEALDWLDTTVSPEEATKAFPDFVKDWISFRGTEDVTDWLSQNSQHQDYDHIASNFVRNIVKNDPDAADQWANTIRNEDLRNGARQIIEESRR